MANVPISNITATWDDAAQTFYGFRLTVTDTLYNSSSKIFDLLTTGGSKFSVDVAGNVNIAGNITSAAQDVHLSNNTTSPAYIHSGSQGAGADLYLAGAGTLTTVSLSVGYTGATLRSPNSLSWTSGTAINTSSDTGLSRYSAGVVKITDGSTGFGSLYAAGIGVGTTTPGELVDVVGNVQAVEFIGSLRGAVLFKAKAGEALTKGDAVYISGISGNITVVSKADANDGSKMPAFGLVKETVSSQAACEVYTFGTFQGLDTSSYTEGTELFVSTTPGVLTDAPPSGESSLIQKIAKVTRSHASAGSLKVIGAGRTNATPNLNNGNIFIGNASNQASTASLSSYLAPYAPIASPTFTGTVTVSGDLNVTGTTTTINTTNLDVQDAVITLNKGQVTPANDIGLLFQRYSTPTASNYNVAIAWDESSDKFIFGKTPETGSDNDLTFNTELMTISESGDTTINATGTALTADTSSSNLAQFARNGSTLINLGGSSGSGQFWLEGSAGGNLSFGRENVTADFVMTNSTHIGGGTELFRVTSGGNVGIGTDSPASFHANANNLVVGSGSGTEGITINSGTANYGVIYFADGTSGSAAYAGSINYNHADNSMRLGTAGSTTSAIIDSSGNLGLGCTPSAHAFSKAIQIGDGAVWTVSGNQNSTFAANAYLAVNGNFKYIGANKASKINLYNGGFTVATTNTSGSADGDITFTDRLTVNSSGNVGIGTNAPTAKLHVAGTADQSIIVQSTDNNGKAGVNFKGAGDRGSIYGTASYDIHIEPNAQYGQADVIINSANGTTMNVGIGTSAPAAKLHIADTFNDVSTVHTGFKLDVTDTASAAGSSLMDLHSGGTSKASIGIDGTGYFGGPYNGGGIVRIGYNTNPPGGAARMGLWAIGAGKMWLAGYSTLYLGYQGKNVFDVGGGSTGLGFASVSKGTPDIGINRDSAGVLKVTDGSTGLGSLSSASLTVSPTYNQTGTAGGTDLLINRTETAIGSGSHYLIDAQVGGTSKFTVANTGDTVVDGALTFASDGAGGNWLKFYRQQANIWRLTTSGIGDVFRIFGNNVIFDQNVTIQRGGLLVQPTLTSTAEPFKGIITFNDVTKTYSAFKLDVTDTASAAGSTLIDVQVGGTSKFNVDTTGVVNLPGTYIKIVPSFSAGFLTIGQRFGSSGFYTGMLLDNSNPRFTFFGSRSNGNTVPTFQFYNNLGFTSSTTTDADVGINRIGAASLKITDGSTGLGSLKASSILLSTDASLTSETATLATVSATQVASFPTTHLGAKLVIQAADTVSGERQISELTIIHDGTTVSVAEYGIVHTGSAALASYTAAIVSTNVIVSATGASANSTTYKVVETLI